MLGKPLMTRHRYSVWRVLKALGAEPVGRVGPRHAILGRLPDEVWAPLALIPPMLAKGFQCVRFCKSYL